jgi:hypothetical protein
MFYNKQNFKRTAFTTLILTILALGVFLQIPGIQKNIVGTEKDRIDSEKPQSSETDYYSKDWITNGDFSLGSTNWTSKVDGDTSDINMAISGGEANYEIIGQSYTKEISDPINLATASNWVAFNKSEPAINPDLYEIDDDGFHVSHSWHDATPDQFASITWRYNVSMGRDMSEFTITEATLDAIMNATVDRNVDVPTDIYAEYTN